MVVVLNCEGEGINKSLFTSANNIFYRRYFVYMRRTTGKRTFGWQYIGAYVATVIDDMKVYFFVSGVLIFNLF